MRWPRYDPSRGYFLCEPCWNGQHWDKAYRDVDGILHPKVSNCRQGGCGCGCVHGREEKRSTKPDYSQQMVIDTGDNVIKIGNTTKHKDEN